ncbi:hypothetical protein F3Y22_tig00004198pilonHSYRG00020 [Hibiscus syriacus]|uniref:Uncharacterized protein n=1 Tax=Hibiscus syriacus TaxID=106335 RepID=A0A6A3CMZ1_HIBSY|nr:hypothetical protein F3Y22_tig00004198pilonHSYRG00020 [Hibiscus syriacus]
MLADSKTLQDLEKEEGTKDALSVCKEVLGYAIDDLSKIDDILLRIQVWLSGALTSQQTCIESFEEKDGITSISKDLNIPSIDKITTSLHLRRLQGCVPELPNDREETKSQPKLHGDLTGETVRKIKGRLRAPQLHISGDKDYIPTNIDDIITLEGYIAIHPGLGETTSYFVEFGNWGHGSKTDGRVKWAGIKQMDLNTAKIFAPGPSLQSNTWIPNTGVPCTSDWIPGL